MFTRVYQKAWVSAGSTAEVAFGRLKRQGCCCRCRTEDWATQIF